MEGPPLYIITAVQLAAAVLLLWLVFVWPSPWDLQRGVGSFLMVAGLAGVVAARYQLGKSFTIKAEARRLVTRGVYSRIRNPIYVCGVVMIAGLVLVLHRPTLWLVVLAIIIMQIFRAHREAQVLEAAFGEAYREYRRKTWF